MKKRIRWGIFAVALLGGGGLFWNQNMEVPEPSPAPGPKFVPTPRVWKNATPAQQKAAERCIIAQLEAFKNNRWQEATKYQSSSLRRNFASPQQFRAMIQGSYPQFASYKSAKFGRARIAENELQIDVRLVGTDGVGVDAIYLLIQEEGLYRVASVQGGLAKKPVPVELEDETWV